MLIQDSFEVPSTPKEVWGFFQDIPRVGACLPGVDSVQETGPNAYIGVLKVKVGPISASFEGRVTITEQLEDQWRIVAQVDGNDRVSATSVKAVFTSQLSQAESGTRVDYDIDVTLRGRLATFGSAVVKGTAKNMTAAFARCVQEALAV